ncbi:MAG: hypothetical protein ACNA7Q_08875 [Rhodobacterales bacterium]
MAILAFYAGPKRKANWSYSKPACCTARLPSTFGSHVTGGAAKAAASGDYDKTTVKTRKRQRLIHV